MSKSEQNIQFFHIDETDSTNIAIQKLATETNPKTIYVLQSDYQTAGRGQKGSSWESERGKNLLFSTMLWPRGIEVGRQFRLSQAMALAICAELNNIQPGFTIKWPNDIYYHEKKVSGTIIETTWRSNMVNRCILGIGINVNQTTFRSDAPNPASLIQITGQETNIPHLLHAIMRRFAQQMEALADGNEEELATQYHNHLIWRDGIHTYRDAQGQFQASLIGIEPDGHLLLLDTEGRQHRYLFKEVKHIFHTIICD